MKPTSRAVLAALAIMAAAVGPATAQQALNTDASDTPQLIESRGIATKLVQDGDYWRLCDDNLKRCFPIVPVYTMAGLNPTLSTAKDGRTPLVYFDILPSTTRPAYELSASVASFMAQFDEAASHFSAVTASPTTSSACRLRTGSAFTGGREGETAPSRPENSCNDDDPDRGIPQVEIPGERPSPYEPNPYPTPGGGNYPRDPGGGHSPAPAPDVSALIRPTSVRCIPLPPNVIACVPIIVVPGARPPADPTTPPPPPPPPKWCELLGYGCTGDPGSRPPNPLRDMCNSRFVVEGAQCMKERLQGRTDRQGEMHCLEKAQAKLAMWMGKATATTPETAPGSDEEPGQ